MLSKITIFFCILLFIACDKTMVFDEYKTLSDGWQKNAPVIFNFQEPDTINKYNLFITLRNNNYYLYSNLFLITTLQFPNGIMVQDTLEYEMALTDGTWLGTGFSDIKENKLWYKEHITFPNKGDYTLKIKQAMRKANTVQGIDTLAGIINVGFRIENTP